MDRKLELLLDGTWVPYEMKDLIVDDVYRMFEPRDDGWVPMNNGAMWLVLELPYFNDDAWGVVCEPIVE